MTRVFRHAWTAALLGCLLLGAAVSVRFGQDANWDLRNYHITNVHAVVEGRLDLDLLSAGLQSYFNPTLDFVYVLLGLGPLATHPRLLAAFMGLFYGGLIFLALRLAWVLLPVTRQPDRVLLAAGTTAMAVTGAATVSEIGTTLNDLQTALPVIAGLLIVLGPVRAMQGSTGTLAALLQPRVLVPWVLAGLLFGLAAGLKLTNLIYAPAFCLALLLVARPLPWLIACGAFSVSWVIGFLPVTLWWWLEIWARFGSPTFPMFNAVFRSPWYPPESFYDLRFMPRTTWEWLAYPFWWVTARQPPRPAELGFRDPRLALLLTALCGLGIAWLVRAFRGLRLGAAQRGLLRPDQVFVCGVSALAYLLWLSGSSILRYALVLEVVGSITTLLVVLTACNGLPDRFRRPAMLGVGTGLCLLVVLWTRPLDWGRVAFREQVFEIDMGWTPPQSLLVAITGPSAYLNAFVPPEREARMLGFSFTTLAARGWRLAAESERMVRTHAGPIFVLLPEGDRSMVPHLAAIGLSPELGPCRTVTSNLDRNTTRACEARRLP